jgi:hypothetical protein
MKYRELLLSFFLIFFIPNRFSKLIGVVEIIRHGARTPRNFLQSSARTFFGSRKAQLTLNGFRQHVLLGRWLRKQYVYKHNLLSRELNTNEVLVFSSPRQRTIFSATAHLMGLFPNSFAKISYHKGDLKNDDVPPLFNYKPSSIDGKEIKIKVIKFKKDYLFHALSCYYRGSIIPLKLEIKPDTIFSLEKEEVSNACRDILDKYAYILQKEKSFRCKEDYEKFQKNYEKKTFSGRFFSKLTSWFIPLKYHHTFYNKLLPQNLMTVEKEILNKYYQIRLRDSKELRISVSCMFENIVRFFDSKIYEENPVKMIIFSGHDNNLINSLSNLINPGVLMKLIENAPNNLKNYSFLIPKLASSIQFELYKDNNQYFINLVYNGKSINHMEFRSRVRIDTVNNLLFYKDFKELLISRIEFDYRKLECLKKGI